VFFSFYFYNPTIRSNILTSTSLFLVFGMAWLVLLVSFCFLLYDFRKMELYIQQEHALKREAYLDELTGIPNRHGFDTVFQTYQVGKDLSNLGCALLSIKNLEVINSTLGYEAGDIIIKDICQLLESIGDKYGFVGRNGGNEFLAVFDDCTNETMKNFHNDIINALPTLSIPNSPKIDINFFYLLNSDAKVSKLSDLVTLTYKKASFM
jgi:diguanylate cyclase (GGDEF)-like protein